MGKSLCTAMAITCAEVCRIFRRLGLLSLVGSLVGAGASTTAAAGAACMRVEERVGGGPWNRAGADTGSERVLRARVTEEGEGV